MSKGKGHNQFWMLSLKLLLVTFRILFQASYSLTNPSFLDYSTNT